MLRSFIAIGGLLLTLLACSKSHTPQPGLIGQWRLINLTGGIPGTVSDYGPIVLQLGPDSSYRKTLGTTFEAGTYRISIDYSGSTPDTLISFSGTGYAFRKLLQMTHLQMTLTDIDISDGYTETYHKQ